MKRPTAGIAQARRRMGEASGSAAGVTSCSSSAPSSSRLRGQGTTPILSCLEGSSLRAFAGLAAPLTRSQLSCLSESLALGWPAKLRCSLSSPLCHSLEFCFLCSSCLLCPFFTHFQSPSWYCSSCRQGLLTHRDVKSLYKGSRILLRRMSGEGEG